MTKITVSVLLGDGTGSFGAKTDFTVGAFPISVAVADFNEDGNQDIVSTNRSSKTISVLLGDGTGSFGTKTDFTAGDEPTVGAVGDLDEDGHLDVAL